MKISDVKVVLKRLIAINESVLLVGHAGVGKTSLVKEVAKELNKTVKTVILSTLEPGDLLGVPHIVNGKTIYERPSWLPEENEENVILFLDELNRAPTYVLQTVLQLVLEHRVGPHVLPKDMAIVAAINPETDDYVVTPVSDRALISRFVLLAVKNSVYDLSEYLKQKGYDNKAIFAAMRGLDKIGKFEETFTLPEPDPNPRSFEKAIRVYEQIKDLARQIKIEVLAGIIGMSAAAQFILDIEENVLTVEDVIRGDVEKFKQANIFERINVLMEIMASGRAAEIPEAILDALTDEEAAAIIRKVKVEPEKYGPAFLHLRKKNQRFKQLLQ